MAAAEHEVVEALREERRLGYAHIPLGSTAAQAHQLARVRLADRLNDLDALLSSLPSREQMAERQCECVGSGANSTELHASYAEYHWSDCLRWVAEHPELDYRALADELEARSS